MITQLLKNNGIEISDIEGAIIASVVPDVMHSLCQFFPTKDTHGHIGITYVYDKYHSPSSSSNNSETFNEEQFKMIPESIKEELHIICVLFTEEVGGVFTIAFEEDGNVVMKHLLF